MTFDEYQKLAMRTDIYKDKTDSLHYGVLGLASEAGEVASKLKKVLRDDGGKISPEKMADFESELGDVLWYIAKVASDLKLPLDSVANKNIKKLKSRQERGTLSGSGDNR